MEENQEGVDWHRDGADVDWKLKLALLAAVVPPVLMAAWLIVAGAAR